jgi:hypothetical protein
MVAVVQESDLPGLVRKAVNLFTFLGRTQQLLVKPVRTVDKFEKSLCHSHGEFEEAWENASSTKRRLGLAVNPDDDNAVDKWLSGGSARREALKTAAKGAHGGVTDYREAVKSTRLAVGDLVKLES